MQVTDHEIALLVEETDGFSFAYLKELFLSAMVRWIRTRAPGGMYASLREQLETLRAQMRTDPRPTPATPKLE